MNLLTAVNAVVAMQSISEHRRCAAVTVGTVDALHTLSALDVPCHHWQSFLCVALTYSTADALRSLSVPFVCCSHCCQPFIIRFTESRVITHCNTIAGWTVGRCTQWLHALVSLYDSCTLQEVIVVVDWCDWQYFCLQRLTLTIVDAIYSKCSSKSIQNQHNRGRFSAW